MSSPNDWQQEAMKRLRQMQTRGGFPSGGGGGPGGPQGRAGMAVAGGLLFTAGYLFFSNALFNVDGGHRAIKYRRISGVSKDIYSEGTAGATGTTTLMRGGSLY